MNMKFSKYQGAGNDFVMVDNRTNFFPKENKTLINKLCDRKFGVGADGLILLENQAGYDFKMVYFNADGSESTMCGNGGRCIVAFAKQLNIIDKNTVFIAIDGEHVASVDEKGEVALGMIDVEDIEKIDNDTFLLFTGSPHYVKVVNEFPDDFVAQARDIRNSARFKKEGVNVNFVTINKEEVQIRTFERGVEDETLACGTGSVAAAIVANNYNALNYYNVITQGGRLSVSFSNEYDNVQLCGPAIRVFEGKINDLLTF